MIDLDAYRERIGLGASGGDDLAALHRAHVTAIPFENLDPHRGVPVSLDPAELERKLVRDRRGGYCFEQNLLFKAALDALGTQVEVFLARVRYGAPPGTVRPRAHVVLRVDGAWHADVGFGLGSPLEPIPFGPGDEHEQAGWRYRVAQDGDEYVLQSAGADGAWEDVYAFLPKPVPAVDLETSNWFVSTHPASPFVSGLIVSRHALDGTRMALSDWSGTLRLTERTPTGESVTEVEPQAVPELLATRFGLGGFAVGADGRVVSQRDPRGR